MNNECCYQFDLDTVALREVIWESIGQTIIPTTRGFRW